MYHYVIVSNEEYKGLNPVIFGYEPCKKSHSFGPAVRGYWLLHYIESGYGVYKINNREYKVGPGEIFVIPPFEETYYEADAENPWSYIWIGFTTDCLPTALDDVIHIPEAITVFNEMKTCEEFKNGRSAFLSAKLWELFSLLLRKKKNTEDYIAKALDCIHAEYMNGITIEEIAQRLRLDRTYFSTLFKKKIGISPKKYLLNYRMNIASSLMLDNGKSVSVTACSVGYTDIFTFSKMFKKHYGLSPHDYVLERKNSHTLH